MTPATHSLLSWAVDFVKDEMPRLEEACVSPDGINDVADGAEAREDLRDAHRWLAEAERELAGNLGAQHG